MLASAAPSASVAPPSGLAYDSESVVYAVGTEIAPNKPRSTGGAIAQYSIVPQLPPGLSLGADGVIRGTPTEVTLPKYYIVTASSAGASTTVRLTIEVRAGPTEPRSLRYVSESVIYGVGWSLVPNYPYVTGGPATAFDVSPALPAGLRIDPQTGIISGSPTTVTPPGLYAVTARNALGSATARLQIEVRAFEAAPGDLRYVDETVVYAPGHPIVPNRPTNKGGPITHFSVSPPLPSGLWLDATSGVISGTPTSISPPQTYTVIGSNTTGSASVALDIEVREEIVAPSNLRYLDMVGGYTMGWPIFPNMPSANGSKITSFSISPALPAGLAFDPQTGVISGTPLNVQPFFTYTVTGSNSAGSTTAQLQIGVGPKPDGFWFTLTYMEAPRTRHFAVSLQDGRVLIGGGLAGAGPTAASAIYSLTSGRTPTGNMTLARILPSATLLRDGRVLVAGGQDLAENLNAFTRSVELFDPVSETWSATNNMTIPRSSHGASLLQDGRVLVSGGATIGYQYTSAELFDPATQTWSATADMAQGRVGHTSTTLPDGRVLVTGGNGLAPTGYASLSSAEIYDPATGTWSSAGNMNRSRAFHTATLLPSGKVLVVGGATEPSTEPSSVTELFDPATGQWSVNGYVYKGLSAHTATLLPDGKVLVAGGQGGPYGGYMGEIATCFVYNPATGNWALTNDLDHARMLHTATVLPDGRVLVIGGTALKSALSSIELYIRYQ